MKPSVLAGLVLALAVSSSAIPTDSNPFGIKQGWGSGWGWVWSPVTPVTDAPVTVAPVTDAPTTVVPVTDAPTTLAPVTDAPVTLPPGTTACIPVTGSTDGCYDTLMSLINWLVPYLINAISTLLTKQGRIPSVFLITEILVQFIICLINALIGAEYPVLDALLAILASRS